MVFHYPPGFHPPPGFSNFPKDQQQRIMDMFEQHMKDMKKEKVSQRQRNTPNTSVAVEVAVKGEATVEDQKKKEKYRREAARKRAGVSFLRLRDSTPWKCEGQSVLGKKD